jgi:lysophospholipase L1-like esterase
VQLGPAFRAERIAGREPMRDVIHPNTDGQRVIAESLFEELERALSGRPATAPTTDATVGQ